MMMSDHESDDPGAVVLSLVERLETLADDDGAEPPLERKRLNGCLHYREGKVYIDAEGRRLTKLRRGSYFRQGQPPGFLRR